jgi:hypothetical protein
MTDMTDKAPPFFIEENIINSAKKLLSEWRNALLREMEYLISPIEFGNYCGGFILVPVISLSAGERTEKERDCSGGCVYPIFTVPQKVTCPIRRFILYP